MANFLRLQRGSTLLGRVELIGLGPDAMQDGVKIRISGRRLSRLVRLSIRKNELDVEIMGGVHHEDLQHFYDGTINALEALGETEGFVVVEDLDMDPFSEFDRTAVH